MISYFKVECIEIEIEFVIIRQFFFDELHMTQCSPQQLP